MPLAAGPSSTAVDLAQFVIAANRGGLWNDGTRDIRVLRQEVVDRMIDARADEHCQNPVEGGRPVGVGLFVGSINGGREIDYYHGGYHAGFRAMLKGIPSRGAGFVIMTNGWNDTGENRGSVDLVNEIVRGIALTYGWN